MAQKIYTQQVEITTEIIEEFKDLVDRRALAINFVSVLMSQNVNVFSINGGWGSGKTWFLKFIEEACQDKIHFIQYNVWENDYLDDPFQSIVSELMLKITSIASTNFLGTDFIKIEAEIKGIQKLCNKFIEVVKNFKIKPKIAYVLPDGTALAAELGIDYDSSKNDDASTYDTMKGIKKEFEKKLQSILSQIKQQEIVIAIDELDRCRPDYAIRTLEVIKHFFHINGLKFILAVDKKQLANTIKALYGQEADTDCYLRKFVDIEYYLQNPKERDITKYVSEFIEKKYPNIKTLCENKNASPDGVLYYNQDSGYMYLQKYSNPNQYTNLICKSIINSYYNADLRLRDLEKLFFKLSIIINQCDKIKAFHFEFLWNLLLVNTKYNDLYKLIEDFDFKYPQIVEYLRTPLNNNYYKFILKNKELMLIIAGIKDKVDANYRYSRIDNPSPKEEISYNYSLDLNKYFDVVNMSIGFE